MQELATKNIKETLDKKYGPAWHVVMGEGYAYDISVQSGAYLLMYYNGFLGCLVFKTWSLHSSYSNMQSLISWPSLSLNFENYPSNWNNKLKKIHIDFKMENNLKDIFFLIVFNCIWSQDKLSHLITLCLVFL